MESDVQVLTDDRFGSEVASFLGDIMADTGRRVTRAALPAPERVAETLLRARVTVLCSEREPPRLCDLLDSAAAVTARSWLPVLHRHPTIRIGPLVTPDQGPCYGCLRLRELQHAGSGPDPGAGPDRGVRGIPAHLAIIAAGLSALLIDEGETGVVHAIDTRDCGGSRTRLVRAQTCSRCRQRYGIRSTLPPEEVSLRRAGRPAIVEAGR